MRIFFFLTFILILSGCATIEVAKEVSKVSTSIERSVKKIVGKEEKKEEIKEKEEESISENISLEEKVSAAKKEKEIVEVEKKRQKKVVKKQKEVTKINFVGKTINEIYMRLGDSSLFRLDGNTQTMRYDSDACRLFLFFNSTLPIPRVDYFEMRDEKGNLIKEKANIESCYKKFDLS
ncbi:hypothetical protein OAJ30_03555 [Alphaproteobacteria bacterium]|nr:hypothetical protein [Alphaproteobacteria bacterium]